MKQSIKRISAVLAMAMALSAFSAFSVFAEGEGTAPASVPQSAVQQAESGSPAPTATPTVTPAPDPTEVPPPEPTEVPVAQVGSYDISLVDGRDNLWDWDERANVTIHFTSGETVSSARLVNNGTFAADNYGTVEVPASGGSITFSNVRYNGGGNTLQFEQSITIAQCMDVNPNPPEPTPTPEPVPTEKPEYDYPKILVKDFSFGGNSVEAGKEFTLELTLFTTSGNANLQDVMVGLNFGELKGVSLASGSMNTYVGEMAPNTTKTISYKMITDATIEPGAISINVNLTSKNGEAATAPISIPVTQPERFDITNMEAPETIMMGEEGYLSVTFVNKGKSAINNLSAEIQGDNPARASSWATSPPAPRTRWTSVSWLRPRAPSTARLS